MEIQRAKSFYRAHRDRLGSAFTDEEIRFIRRGVRPHERVALLLAAKEAAFKALPGRWRGLTGFKDVPLLPRSARPRLPGRQAGALRFRYFKNKKYVIVHCSVRGQRAVDALGTSRAF